MRMQVFTQVVADEINDTGSTRLVYLLALALVLLGAGLVAITVWFWRNSRPEPQLLAPLEVMEATKFRRMSRLEQRRLLDSVRPPGAEPVNKSVSIGALMPQPEVDLRAIGKAELPPIDDLRDDLLPLGAPGRDDTSNLEVDDAVAIDPLLRMFEADELG